MKEQSKIAKFLSGKGFYLALGICLVALGVSGWSAFSGINNTDTKDLSSLTQREEISSEVTVDKTQSGVADTSEKAAPTNKTSSTTKKPEAKYFLYPINGEIIKPFSENELQYSLTYNDMRIHTGIDIKAKAGTSVKASGDGVVTFAGEDSLLGYTVKINHGNGIVGVYAGLNKNLAVKKNDEVKAGQTLGALGTVTNECVDAAHLHLEFYDNQVAIDPLSLLVTTAD